MGNKNNNSQQKLNNYVTSSRNFLKINHENINKPLYIQERVETHTHDLNIGNTLKFKIYDPLWMLSRQWQLGEFKGNDAGTAMSVKCKMRISDMDHYFYGNDPNAAPNSAITRREPIEPAVERIDHEITPIVRVESAMYFMELLCSVESSNAAFNKRDTLKVLRTKFPLFEEIKKFGKAPINNDKVKEFTRGKNIRLQQFEKAFAKKAFDGYLVYLEALKSKSPEGKGHLKSIPADALHAYTSWFENRYTPNSKSYENPNPSTKSTQSAWVNEQLGYDFGVVTGNSVLQAKDYSSGKLSWYCFDKTKKRPTENAKTESKTISSLPTIASYTGAPNKRLWQFEDRSVFMGNSTEMQAKGNIAFLQYATMYGNDWMLCPLNIPIGKRLQVEEITIYDTFGIHTVINQPASEIASSQKFGQRWQMYTNAPENIHTDPSDDALMFPPSLMDIQESAPVEEVCLLRDEMANMVWGVETRIGDGCGKTLDAALLASEIKDSIDEWNLERIHPSRLQINNPGKEEKAKITNSNPADFNYVVQTSVPLNWIPFQAQHIDSDTPENSIFKNGGRETILRRATMPCFLEGEYRPVRPLSNILRQGIDQDNKVTQPYFINEEEVQGVGTRIQLSYQRSRWLNGETYNWLGYQTQIKNTQGESGLAFDQLTDVQNNNN